MRAIRYEVARVISKLGLSYSGRWPTFNVPSPPWIPHHRDRVEDERTTCAVKPGDVGSFVNEPQKCSSASDHGMQLHVLCVCGDHVVKQTFYPSQFWLACSCSRLWLVRLTHCKNLFKLELDLFSSSLLSSQQCEQPPQHRACSVQYFFQYLAMVSYNVSSSPPSST